LITVSQSTYCEAARWALQYARVPFVEDAYHMPMIFMGQGPQDEVKALRTDDAMKRLQAKGSISVHGSMPSQTMLPIAVVDGTVLADSFEILEYAAKYANIRPLSTDWEVKIDQFADSVRALWYHHFTKQVAIGSGYTESMLVEAQRDNYLIFGDEAYWNEAGSFPFDGLGVISEEREKQVCGIIAAMLDAAESKLAASGKNYLGGDEPGMDDIAFAAGASWIMLPPNFGGPLGQRWLQFDQCPPKFQEMVQSYRSRTAGKLVKEIYDTCRLGYGGIPFEKGAHQLNIKC